MASFTDIIPQFNPYIQQLPVEAMVKVGMQKQAQYEAGVQKIQSQIDNIAGLDVYKSQHKQYLQSKLNELGGNLRGLAAGDFSNFQLVNSVSGMTSQITKDPIVQNAVASTQRIRKEQENIQTAQKNGKSSVENEWWFNSSLNNWLNDSDLSKQFTGEFIEYTDLDKKLRDVAGKIKETERSVDIPFQRDESGNVLYFKTDKTSGKTTVSTDPNSGGEKRIDDAMLRVKVKGTSAQKILDNFYMSLDENDKRQLQITSAYHYRGATKDTFKNDITATVNAQKKMLTNQIVEWSVQLKSDSNLTSEQKSQLEAAIKAGNDKLNSGDFEKKIAEKVANIDRVTDLDSYKYQVYSQKYLTGLADAISNESRIEEIMSNPYAQMDMEKKKLEFQVERAKVQDRQWWADHAVSVEKLNIERAKWNAELAEKAALQPIVERGGLGTNQALPTLGDLDAARTQTQTSIDSANSSFGNLLFPNLQGEARKQALANLVSKYATNPNSITDNNQRDYVEMMRSLNNKLAQQNGLYVQAQAVTKDIDAQVSRLFAGYGGVTSSNGVEMFTAEQLYRVRAGLDNFRSSVTVGSPIAGQSSKVITRVDEEKYLNSLPANLKALGRVMLKWNSGQQLSPSEKVIIDRSQELTRTFRPQADALVMQGLKKQSEYLASYMPEVQTTFGTLNIKDKVTDYRIKNLVGNAVKRYDELGALDVNRPGDFTSSTINKWMETPDKLTFVAEKRYDGSGQLVVYKEGEKQVIPMTADQLASYFPNVAKTSFMTEVKYRVLSSPGRTTNAISSGDPVNAYMSGYDVPGLRQSSYAPRVRVDIEGAPKNDGGDRDRFQVRMYVFNGSTWKDAVLNQQGYVNASGVEEIVDGIGPTTVKQVLNR